MSWFSKAVKKVIGTKTYNNIKNVASYAFPVTAIANFPKDFVKSGAANLYGQIAAPLVAGQMVGKGGGIASSLFGGQSQPSSPTDANAATGYNFGDLFSTLLKQTGGGTPGGGASGGSYTSEPSTQAAAQGIAGKYILWIFGGVMFLVLIILLATRRR